MVILKRCDSSNEDFLALTLALDADLTARNGQGQQAYDGYNRIAGLSTVLLATVQGRAVGCGCFKAFAPDTAELKRIFVLPHYRGRGIARQLVRGLEEWAGEQGFRTIILETGLLQQEAIRLYESCGYRRCENYGQYAGMPDSVCFTKALNGAR